MRFIYPSMPPYHQGHPFPVSSSPIRPLDAHPIRSKRPSPLSVSDTPRRVTTTSGVATIGQNAHEYVSDTARSVPTNWTDNATAVHLDTSTLGSQYGQVTAGSAGITSSPPYLPSCSPASIPAGWDEPMVLSPYTPFPHGPQGGTTFFYRSPTPTARQRTNQACEKCRDRKTKVRCAFRIRDHIKFEADFFNSAAVGVQHVIGVKPGGLSVSMPLSIEYVVPLEPERGTCHPLMYPRPSPRLEHRMLIILMLLQRLWAILDGTCNLYPPKVGRLALLLEQAGLCRTTLMSPAILAVLLLSSCPKGLDI